MKKGFDIRELRIKVGDVLICEDVGSTPEHLTIGKEYEVISGPAIVTDKCLVMGEDVFAYRNFPTTARFSLKVEAKPKRWKDMTPEEKGALLLAHHEGKEIEFFASYWEGCEGRPSWLKYCAYRVKPEPVVETVEVYGENAFGGWSFGGHIYMVGDCYKITLTLIDGEVQPNASVEKL